MLKVVITAPNACQKQTFGGGNCQELDEDIHGALAPSVLAQFYSLLVSFLLSLLTGFKIESEPETSRLRVEDLKLSPCSRKIDASTGGWGGGGWRLVGAIAFNKLLSQLIEEA